jgi:tetratricopeptide (TPR) repeat protein
MALKSESIYDMAKILDDKIYRQITRLTGQGDELVETGEYRQALALYLKALDLVPDPIDEWEASTWIFAAIGDCYFLLRDFENARAAFNDAMHCPGAIGNPFLHLRLGQSQLEIGNDVRAADELMRAYMGGGPEIFEDEDGKYLAFLRTKSNGI